MAFGIKYGFDRLVLLEWSLCIDRSNLCDAMSESAAFEADTRCFCRCFPGSLLGRWPFVFAGLNSFLHTLLQFLVLRGEITLMTKYGNLPGRVSRDVLWNAARRWFMTRSFWPLHLSLDAEFTLLTDWAPHWWNSLELIDGLGKLVVAHFVNIASTAVKYIFFRQFCGDLYVFLAFVAACSFPYEGEEIEGLSQFCSCGFGQS